MNMIGIDEDFYSRQIGTYGLDTLKNIMKLRVLIYGLRGLGMEIAKNIILMGPKQVSLYDKNIISYFDLGSGFYFLEEQISKFQRDEGCVEKLSQLNSYVEVEVLKEDLISSIQNYNVIVITEIINIELLNKINEICRKNQIGLIYGAVLGLLTFTFVDFGDKFIIKDKNGKTPERFFIKDISNSNFCKIILDIESIQTNPLKDGDLVILKEIEGMTELNNKIKKIIVKSEGPLNEVYIEEDSTHFNKYIRGGILEEVKVPIKKEFLRFNECLIKPKHQEKLIDDEKDQIRHSIIYGIMKYFDKNNSLPELNEEIGSKKIVEYAKNYFEERKKCDDWFNETSEDFDESMAFDLAKWSRAELIPLCSFMGGIIAQEIVKFTGKFIPIEQWIWFDFYDTIRELKINDRILKKSRYDEQISIYGNNIQNKLEKSNIFIIGAGAIGCEYLKIFSMMGIATAKKSKITITDNDNIEISNLNRQFLFRKKHAGFNKAVCACEEIRRMNKNINCDTHTNLVCEETEYIYDEEFYKNQDFIINAVDNNKARKYIDSQCLLFNKILIDSGTEGLKAHNQLIIPKVTDHGKFENYNNNNVPMCTLRQFPSTINHCIEWGKDKFDEYFIEDINFIKEFILESPKILKSILTEDEKIKIEKLHKIKVLLSIYINKNINDIIMNSIKIFIDNFILNIQKLIDMYPEDLRNEQGNLFWSGSKRFPSIIKLSKENSLVIEFIESYTKIICHIFNIIYDEPKLKEKIIDNISNNAKFKYEEKNETELEKNIKDLINKIGNKNMDISPELFEKDNDKNNHINFIYASSNLRAENYKIPKFDRLKVKFIAGKIIPAVSTTTACITGFSAMQILTLLHNNKRQLLNELTINLALALFNISKPSPIENELVKKRKKLIYFPKHFTIWEHFNIEGPMKIKDFIKDIKNKYGIKVLGIYPFQKNISLIINQESLENTFEDNYCKVLKIESKFIRNTLAFEIEGKDKDKNNVLMPVFIYRFKNK